MTRSACSTGSSPDGAMISKPIELRTGPASGAQMSRVNRGTPSSVRSIPNTSHAIENSNGATPSEMITATRCRGGAPRRGDGRRRAGAAAEGAMTQLCTGSGGMSMLSGFYARSVGLGRGERVADVGARPLPQLRDVVVRGAAGLGRVGQQPQVPRARNPALVGV